MSKETDFLLDLVIFLLVLVILSSLLVPVKEVVDLILKP